MHLHIISFNNTFTYLNIHFKIFNLRKTKNNQGKIKSGWLSKTKQLFIQPKYHKLILLSKALHFTVTAVYKYMFTHSLIPFIHQSYF